MIQLLILAANLVVGDCVFQTSKPFLGYRAIVSEILPNDKVNIRFCDETICLQLTKPAKDLKKIPDVECDSIR